MCEYMILEEEWLLINYRSYSEKEQPIFTNLIKYLFQNYPDVFLPDE